MLRRLRRSCWFCGMACALAVHLGGPAHAVGIIRITEVMSASGTGGTADWFELTNYGDESVTITNWKMDDDSQSFAAAALLSGITSIASGKSVVFIEGTSTTATNFATYWGGSVTTTGVPVGFYSGSGTSLGSNGDKVTIFDSVGTQVAQVSFGAATTGTSFYWTYTGAGAVTGAGTVVTSAVLSSAGNLGAFTSTSTPTNVGSPGVAITVAESADRYWAANGTALGGSGTWNASNANWSASDSTVVGAAWVADKNAFFKGTAGTVTLGSAVAAGNVTIESDGYTLAAGGGSLNAPQISVATAGHTATVAAPLTGSGLTKDGAGTLVITNVANAYAGVTSVAGGTLRSGNANVIPDGSQVTAALSATYDFDGRADTIAGLAGLGTVTNIGGLTVNVGGATDVTFNGTLSGSGAFIVDSAGSGRQVFSSTTGTESVGAQKNYTGATIVRRGTLAIAGGGNAANRIPSATSGVEIETDGRLEFTSNGFAYTLGASPSTVVTLKGGSLGQEQDEDVTLANAVDVATSSAVLVRNTTTPVTANTEEVTLSGVLSGGAGTILSLTASNQTPGADAGRVLFTNPTGNSYAGTVSVGQNMTGRFDGNYATTAVLLVGGAVEGNGVVQSIGGLGLVSPGTSPGILTADAVDPASGVDFAFEFTAVGAPSYGTPAASINDVLRLTSATPFTGSVTMSNVIDVYLGLPTAAENDAFQGGFFTLTNEATPLAAATLRGWVLGDGAGTDSSLNGVGYYALATFNATLSLRAASIPVTADFGAGPVNGFATQFSVVPEPGALAWLGCGLALAAGTFLRRRSRRAGGIVARR